MNAVHAREARGLEARATPYWYFLAAAALMLQGSEVHAQVMEQTFHLQAGWNAVYVEVDPDPADLDVLLDGLAVESVWVREDLRRGTGSSPCADGSDGSADSACLASTDTGWRVWFPAEKPQRVIQSLRSLSGGRVYLIEASEPATWSVRGRPNASVTRWRRGFGLGGFHVVDQAEAAPTFATYLAASPEHQGGAVFAINADGSLARVVDPGKTRIAPGQGYWVETSRNTVYDGPIRIDPRSLHGLELGPGIAESFIKVENLSNAKESVTVTDATTLGPKASSTASAGRIPLKWYDFAGGSPPQWRTLDHVEIGLESKGSPGSKRTIRIGVDRAQLARLDSDADEPREHKGVLAVTDASGYRRLLPVTSRGDLSSGLWVGDVTIDSVLFLTGGDDVPTPTSSEFAFRIIIHKNAPDYRLLRDVVLVYRDADSSYLLVTPSCPELLSANDVSPRISSANFSFDNHVVLTGDFATQLAGSIVVGAVDSLSPFFHPFNPIHDEGFEITRNITLTFDADGGGDPEWGVTRLAGTYEESIIGLHRNQIEAIGRFELRRVSSVGTLCGP